jgi:ABC transporter substrate binding protein
MRRRKFITLLGVAAVWPLAASAQPGDRIRRIGVLLPQTSDDTEAQTRVGAFLHGLQQSGWSDGRNVRIDTRWATTNADNIRRHAAELVALAPDVILANGSAVVGALQHATRTVPIVFVVVAEPVGAGIPGPVPAGENAPRQDIPLDWVRGVERLHRLPAHAECRSIGGALFRRRLPGYSLLATITARTRTAWSGCASPGPPASSPAWPAPARSRPTGSRRTACRRPRSSSAVR